MAETDPVIAAAIAHELARQQDVIELIASENIVSRAVLEVQGSIVANEAKAIETRIGGMTAGLQVPFARFTSES